MTELAIKAQTNPPPVVPASPGNWLDCNAVGMWLEPYRTKSPETYRAYQRAASYWLYYLEMRNGFEGDLLFRVGSSDAHGFICALTHESPNPSEGHVQGGLPAVCLTEAKARPNHAGVKLNPFAKAKSSRSVALIIAALSSLYRFNSQRRHAEDTALLDFNPFADLGRFIVKADHKTDRLFEVREYNLMLKAADALLASAETPAQRQRALRMRWITVAFYNLWLRVSELAKLKMSDFRLRGGVWYCSTHGKGRKVRAVECTQEVLQELKRYRESLGLSGLPDRAETLPAIVRIRSGQHDWVTARWLREEVYCLARHASARLRADPDFEDNEANRNTLYRLDHLSPHWHRHSGASETLNAGFPLADAAERLGHHNPGLTSRMYYHGDAKRRVSALEAIAQLREPAVK